MFRASPCPSSGATTTAVAASGLPLELGDSSAVGRGRAGCIWLVDSIDLACFWRDSPQLARVSSFTMFLDHTQLRTKVGRTPLDE